MSLDHPASLVQRIDNLLRKLSFRRVLAVLLQLRCATGTENDALVHVEYGMVLAPPQRNIGKAQVVFFLERSSCLLGAVALIETKKKYRDAFEQLKNPEIAFPEVTGAVHLTEEDVGSNRPPSGACSSTELTFPTKNPPLTNLDRK